MSRCIGMLLIVLTVRLSLADDFRLDINQPYSAERHNPVTYDADIVFTVTAPYQTKQLRVWLPIPPSDRGQKLLSSELSTFPEHVEPALHTEPVFGNRFAYFEFTNPQGAQIIRHRFHIKVWELRWHLDATHVAQVSEWPDAFAPFLRTETQAIIVDERFEKLLNEIVPQHSNPLLDLQAVMKWTHQHFIYDHNQASLQASSLHAFNGQRGHCSDYHGFCAAMGRVMSVPTRVTYGMNTFPKSSPSHCKLETYLPPYGWVSFDVSETQKCTLAIAASPTLTDCQKEQFVSAAHYRLFRGFRDNTWFLQTKGSDYELQPPASRRVAVVRTIYAEADGKPLPDPDPANTNQTTFAWMTAQRFQSDAKVTYPFEDTQSLREWITDDPQHESEDK